MKKLIILTLLFLSYTAYSFGVEDEYFFDVMDTCSVSDEAVYSFKNDDGSFIIIGTLGNNNTISENTKYPYNILYGMKFNSSGKVVSKRLIDTLNYNTYTNKEYPYSWLREIHHTSNNYFVSLYTSDTNNTGDNISYKGYLLLDKHFNIINKNILKYPDHSDGAIGTWGSSDYKNSIFTFRFYRNSHDTIIAKEKYDLNFNYSGTDTIFNLPDIMNSKLMGLSAVHSISENSFYLIFNESTYSFMGDCVYLRIDSNKVTEYHVLEDRLHKESFVSEEGGLILISDVSPNAHEEIRQIRLSHFKNGVDEWHSYFGLGGSSQLEIANYNDDNTILAIWRHKRRHFLSKFDKDYGTLDWQYAWNEKRFADTIFQPLALKTINDGIIIVSQVQKWVPVGKSYPDKLMVTTFSDPTDVFEEIGINPEEILIYPNPAIAGNSVNVSLYSEKSNTFAASIADIQGRQVSFPVEKRIHTGKNTFSLKLPDNITSGIYMLMLEGKAGTIMKKIIVNR